MNRYTQPRLVKGPKPTNISKGSTLEKEWAKNTWYVNYSFNGKQYRIKNNINQFSDPKEKAERATLVLEAIKQELAEGYNPQNPTAYLDKFRAANITLRDAVNEYLEQKGHYLRTKSVQSYESKLSYLVDAFPQHQLKEITTKQIEGYIYKKIHKGEQAIIKMEGTIIKTNKITKWTPATVKAAKGYFRAFFGWCVEQGYITENPAKSLNKRAIRSEAVAEERHIPFTPEDLKAILNYLDTNDGYTAFFCRMIYFTCLRPAEIVSLRVADLNLKHKTISVQLSGMKNTVKTEADLLTIDNNLLPHLEQLNLPTFPSHYYLFSNDYKTITGEQTAGNNRAYKRFVKALEALNLSGKGYTLYSFKHTSNINRYNAGWTLPQIMKANRHSSIAMSEKYLRNLTHQTDISELSVPGI
jgi:integrase